MPYLPKTFTALVTDNANVSRVSNSVKQTVQPTLDFLNTYLAPAADGSLRVLRNLNVVKNLIVNGSVTCVGLNDTGDFTASGNVNLFPPTGVFIIPGANATPLVVTNPANNAYVYTLTNTGVATAVSYVSQAGFKLALSGGTYGATNVAASTFVQHQVPTAIGTQNTVIPMPFAGSLVGISGQFQGTSSGATVDVLVNKNNAQLWQYNGFLTSYSNGSLNQVSAKKGLYPFAVGDFITVLSRYSAAGNVQLQITLWIEVGA